MTPSENPDLPNEATTLGPEETTVDLLTQRINTALDVADEIKEKAENPTSDSERNFLTIVSALFGLPIAYILFVKQLFVALGILAIPASAWLVFALISFWSARMVKKLRERAAKSLIDLAQQIGSDDVD